MNIAWVLPVYHSNLHVALKALRQSGYRIHLICGNHREGADEVADTYEVKEQESLTLPSALKLLRALNPDLVVIRKTGKLSRLLYWASVIQRRKVLGYDQRPYLCPRHLAQVLLGPLKGKPMHRFTPVHGLPGVGKPDPRATYLPFPVEPMPHGGSREYAPGGTVRILCVAKLTEERKNHFLLLRALEPLAAEFDFEVTFVGGSNPQIKNPNVNLLEALQDYATHGPMAPRVSIRKDVAFVEMNEIYRNHDICVLPSRAEPLGTAPLEAMAQGCAAVISSDSGSAYYVQSSIEAGRACGAIFATNNISDLRNVLANLLSDVGEITKCGQNAIEWTRSQFSPSLFSERAQSIFGRSK